MFAKPFQSFAFQFHDILIVEKHFSFCIGNQLQDGFAQSGFPATGFPHQSHSRPIGDIQIDMVHCADMICHAKKHTLADRKKGFQIPYPDKRFGVELANGQGDGFAALFAGRSLIY